jgi:hypothetical protein
MDTGKRPDTGGAALRTRQVAGLSGLFDCLRHVTAEVTLHFTPAGLRIGELAATNALFVHVLLQRERFEVFEGGASVTIRTSTLHSVLKAITRQLVQRHAEGLLELRTSDGALQVRICTLSAEAPLYDGDDVAYTLPCALVSAEDAAAKLQEIMENEQLLLARDKYCGVLYMSARHLSHLVSHMFPLGDTINVSCDEHKVTFVVENAHSLITHARVTFRTQPPADAPPETASPSAPCRFSQPMMAMLLRAMSLHNTTAVLLPRGRSEGTPAMMQGNVGDLGTMSVAIAQVVV